MTTDPELEVYNKELIEILKAEVDVSNETRMLDPELQAEKLNLEAFNMYLDFIEQRMQDSTPSSAD